MKLKSFKPSFYIVGYPMEPDVRQEVLGGSLFLSGKVTKRSLYSVSNGAHYVTLHIKIG